VLLEACDFTQDGSHLGFYPKLEIIKKWQKMTFLILDLYVEYDIMKHFASYVNILCFYCPQKVKSMHFYSKMACPPATYYDKSSCDHSN